MPMDITDERIARAGRIAKAIGRGRFREEVLGDAYLALVEAEANGMSPEEAERRVRDKCRNAVRRQWRYENRISFVAPKGASVATSHADLWEAIKVLPPRQYRAVVLYFWEGLSGSEIAVEMQCSRKAVENLIGRALSAIKNIFSDNRGFLPSSLRTAHRGKIPALGIDHQSHEVIRRVPMNLLSLTEVARRFGVCERTARQFKGQLPGEVRVGRRVKYTEEAITDFIRRGGCRPVESPSTGATA
jgi:predicted DNA-binding protein (UPF0251 family)